MSDLANPCIKEALLYEKLSGGRVRCGTCERRCALSPGERGFCKTRQNTDGKLYTLVYGDASSISNNPIEKRGWTSSDFSRKSPSSTSGLEAML